MASKDQAIGALIFIVCLVVGIVYTIALFWPEIIVNTILNWGYNSQQLQRVEFWLVAIPMFVVIVAVLAIGAWIGWTMSTTPPPKPLEELEAEEKPEPTEKVKTEGKKEK
jgi:predicted DNA-binding transcriptional regulator